MYGLVKQAIELLVTSNSSQERWEEIIEHARVDVQLRSGHESIPDNATYILVQSAAKVIELPEGLNLPYPAPSSGFTASVTSQRKGLRRLNNTPCNSALVAIRNVDANKDIFEVRGTNPEAL